MFPFLADPQQNFGMEAVPPATGSARAAGTVTFAVTALVFLVLGCLMLAGRPGFLLTDTLTGHGQAWVNLMLFGFLLPAVFAAVYGALPRAFGVPLYSEQLLFLHYGFHLAGLLVVMLVPFVPELPQAPMGAICLACGSFLFLLNVGVSLRGLARPDAASAFVSTACLWLAAVVLLGLPFSAVAPLAILDLTDWRAGWFVLVFAGVVFNTIFGLALRVAPHCLGLRPERTHAAWYALAVINVGMAWSAAAVTFVLPKFLLLTTGVFVVGALIFLFDFRQMLRRSTGEGLGRSIRMLRIALWVIPAVALLLGLDAFGRLGVEPTAVAGAEEAVVDELAGPAPITVNATDWVLGLSALLGAAVPGLLALLFEMQQRRPGAMNESRIMRATLLIYASGVILILAGLLAEEPRMSAAGAILIALGAIGFLGSFLRNLGQRETVGEVVAEIVEV